MNAAAEVVSNKTHRAHRVGAKAEKRKETLDKKRERLAEGTHAATTLANEKKGRKDPRVSNNVFVHCFDCKTFLKLGAAKDSNGIKKQERGWRLSRAKHPHQ